LNNKKTKILVFATAPPPFHGASIAIKHLTDSVLKDIYTLQHINPRYSKNVNELDRFDITKIFLFFKYQFLLIIRLIFYHPEIVIFSPAFNYISFLKDSVPLFITEIIFRRKCIVWIHGNGLKVLYDNSGNLFKKYIRTLFSHSYKIIPVAMGLCKQNYNFFVTDDKITILNNGIPDRNKLSVIKNTNNIQVLYFSNMIVEKGWKVLFEAATEICSEISNVNFVFAGAENGNIDEIIDVFSNSKFIDRIKYIGPKYDDEKEIIFKESDIFCFPTFYPLETFGIVNIEAMMYSLPIITSCFGGIPEIVIDEKSGYLLKSVDVISLKEKLLILISNPELRKKMGEFNRNRYDEYYTLVVFINNWIKLIEKC
jgi:glycosyltransferase involved in cell wall biosynthesis